MKTAKQTANSSAIQCKLRNLSSGFTLQSERSERRSKRKGRQQTEQTAAQVTAKTRERERDRKGMEWNGRKGEDLMVQRREIGMDVCVAQS